MRETKDQERAFYHMKVVGAVQQSQRRQICSDTLNFSCDRMNMAFCYQHAFYNMKVVGAVQQPQRRQTGLDNF